MEVWLYRGSAPTFALTRKEDGANLPAHLGPWSMIRPVHLDAQADDEKEAVTLIQEHGFCCFE